MFNTCVPQMMIIWCTKPENGAWQNILPFCVIFCPFSPLATQKIKILKKWKKKCLKILTFYTCAPKVTIIWCTVPEIWRVTDKIFCHFGSFFALLPHLPEKSKFWKNEKKPGDNIILNLCTTNDNHMMYGSWDIGHDRQIQKSAKRTLLIFTIFDVWFGMEWP